MAEDNQHKKVHTLIRNPLIAIEIVMELVAKDIELPAAIISTEPIPLETTFKRIQYIREVLEAGEIVVADAEAYFHGAEGLPNMSGEIYVYFDSPRMLGKRFVDNDVTNTSPIMRLRRVYPPLELGPIT